MPLSDTSLRALKPGPRPYKRSDRGGLHVLVNPGGSVLWRLAYRFNGKQKLLALGSFPAVSLRDARRRRDEAKEQLARGEDPGQVKRIAKLKGRVAAEHTFAAIADEWFEHRKNKWTKSYAGRLRGRLDRELVSVLGRQPISAIEPIEVLDALRKVEKRGALETARRAMQIASAIFRYGVATSRCDRDPTADLRGALRAPAPVQRRSALRTDELPKFLADLDAFDGDEVTAIALRLALYTFVRTGELRFAEWREFEGLEGEEALWRIPPARMKMRRAHLVPLAPQVVKLLLRLRSLSESSPMLFASPTRSGVMSENTMLFALYRMGYHRRATVHGFRSTASTLLNEQGFNRDWVEMQLAHVDGGVRAVYNSAEWLQGRRQMMVWWADYLDRIKS